MDKASIAGRHPSAAGTLYYRHRLPVRIAHWINVLCLTILFMSGLGIFNAHPYLYWGNSSYSGKPALLAITSVPEASQGRQWSGVVRIFGREFDTSGVLGLSRSGAQLQRRAFPEWATIPGPYSLAGSRSWHFFFAWLFVLNGLFYLLYALFSGHLGQDLAPDSRDWRGIGRSLIDHLLLRHPRGEAAQRYNVLQKLAYLAVILVLLPLIGLMGMAMSPGLDSLVPGWVDWFGGRQAARTLHFVIAWLLVGFVLIHVFEAIVSGLWNHLRSMITGYYRVDAAANKE